MKLGKIIMSIVGVVVLVLAISFVVSGCASVGNKALKKETKETVEQKIVKGKTTKEEIKAMFGDPVSTNFTDSGNLIWHYEFVNTQAKAVNFIPIINLFESGMEGEKKELVIFFDKNGVVQNFSMSTSEVDYRQGITN